MCCASPPHFGASAQQRRDGHRFEPLVGRATAGHLAAKSGALPRLDQRSGKVARVEVGPNGGPPLHVHHGQEETIHVLKGRYKVQIGDETFQLAEGGFAYLPSGVPHAFLNLTDDPGEIIVVYTPGGGHKFYEELGPLTRNGMPDRAVVAAVFEKHDMSLLGPPLTDD